MYKDESTVSVDNMMELESSRSGRYGPMNSSSSGTRPVGPVVRINLLTAPKR